MSDIEKGNAEFYPSRIKFSMPFASSERMRLEYNINRKDLSYVVYFSSIFSDTVGWITNDKAFEKGKCIIIPNPTAGNKI
jgi:hypothetical protein